MACFFLRLFIYFRDKKNSFKSCFLKLFFFIVPNRFFEITKIDLRDAFRASRVVLWWFLGTRVHQKGVLTFLVHRYEAGTIRLLYHGTIRLLYHNYCTINQQHYYCTGSLYGQYDVNRGFLKGLGSTLAHYKGPRWVRLLKKHVGTIIGFEKKELLNKNSFQSYFFLSLNWLVLAFFEAFGAEILPSCSTVNYVYRQ